MTEYWDCSISKGNVQLSNVKQEESYFSDKIDLYSDEND